MMTAWALGSSHRTYRRRDMRSELLSSAQVPGKHSSSSFIILMNIVRTALSSVAERSFLFRGRYSVVIGKLGNATASKKYKDLSANIEATVRKPGPLW